MAFFQSRGQKLHYETVGSGPAILLIHGFTNHGMVWAEQITDLVHAGFRVIMPGPPGHRLSPRAEREHSVAELTQDMLNLLDHPSIDKAIVCGLSLGGRIAQY